MSATAKKTINKSVKQPARVAASATSHSDYVEALASQPEIDEFCDTLWLEDGLAKNSLDAYRRDLRLFAVWLLAERGKTLLVAHADDLNAYFFAKHETTKATSSNRRLAVLKRFYQLALRQNRISDDPCLKLRSAKQPPRTPKTLSEAQVDALLAARKSVV